MRDLLQTCAGHGPALAAGAARRYDELFDEAGALRPHWESFVAHAESFAGDAFKAAGRHVAQQLQDNGVTYNVQTAGSPARIWTLDVLPHIVAAGEWERLVSALRQRARLLEAVVRDIYGAQRLVARGVLPPALVFGHRGFLPAAHGVAPAGGAFLQLIAFDLGRGADGEWRVMSTRSQAPSGAGYLLENRLTISRLFPDAFREQRVQRLAPFFRALQETFRAAAPGDDPSPLIVLLTPGRYNETYFEHAYLSRYLGFTLVEGPDLTVRDDCVFLKTVGGLRRVHAILRRLDDDFCDPVELRADSTLGVPGIVQAWRAGNVLVANAFGSGVLESRALNAFLPAVAEALDMPFGMASPRAWWCGDVDMLPMIEQRLDELVIMPAVDAGPTEGVIGAYLDAGGRQEWIERLRTWPERYVAEEYLPLSHTPTWMGERLERRAVLMRVFLAHDGGGNYHVLPGGLSCIGDDDADVFTGQRGGGSKDTWVLSAAPVEPLSLLPGRLRADIVRGERVVSSRAAEHLFWMGRYAERSENAARLLRAILSRQPQGDASTSASSPPVVAACRGLELLPADGAFADAGPTGWEQMLIAGITDATGLHSLAFNVAQTLRVASTVRDRLSADNWRLLNGLTETLTAPGRVVLSLAEAIALLDEAIIRLVAVGGLEMAHMTRDDGWRFLSLGRHLERAVYVIDTVSAVAHSELAEDPALLEWLLDLSDSIITYRAQYMGHADWILVADLLLFDRRNPRSAAFQLAKLAKHVPQLPGRGINGFAAPVEALAGSDERTPAAVGTYLEAAGQLVRHLSDALERRYFSHVYEPAHATLI